MQVSITFDDKKKCKILNPWNIYVTLKKNYCNNIWLPVCLHFSYLCFAKLKWAGGHCPWQVRDHACCRGETGVPVQSKLSQCYKMCLQCFANTCLPSDAICRACSLFVFFFQTILRISFLFFLELYICSVQISWVKSYKLNKQTKAHFLSYLLTSRLNVIK